MSDPLRLPLATAHIEGTGGVLKLAPEDFRVDEIPAYVASGDGDHVLARIEKRGLSTFDLVARLAGALGVSDRDIGTAGLKDKHAVATQQISLPPPVTPEQVMALAIGGVTILSAARHPNKLRTGHSRGNRFAIVIRRTSLDSERAAALATETLAVLTRAPGSPNWFGEQRFGVGGNNADVGRALVDGSHRGRKPGGKKLRLMLSALQSQLFNNYLERRIADGVFHMLIPGDVMQKTDSGGVFVTEDIEIDRPRFEAGEVVVTGPMFGPRMKRPPAASEADRRESAILVDAGLEPDAFTRYAKLTPGARRSLSVALGDTRVKPMGGAAGEGAIEVTFTLPSGSYATSVLREILYPLGGKTHEHHRTISQLHPPRR